MSALAIVAFDSFTPVERAVVAAVALGAGLIVARIRFPHLAPVAPFAATAILLPFGVQQEQGADTAYRRTSFAFGAGATRGGYEVTRDDCEGNPITRTQHNYNAVALLAEYGTEYSPGIGRTLRLLGFVGEDNSPTATYVGSPPPTPDPSDAARHDPMGGVVGSMTFDWHYGGMTLGAATGRLVAARDYPHFGGGPIPSRTEPVVGLRFGSLTSGFVDFGYLTHQLGAVPDHRFNFGLGIGEATGRRTFRIGMSESSLYLSGRISSGEGFEFEPYASVGSARRHNVGVTVKRRFGTRP